MRNPIILVLAAVAAWFAAESRAAITGGRPIPVRILYDNSGSMHPGYTPPGTPDRRTKAELGVEYFHRYPQFRQWLNDFVRVQTRLDARSVGMWTFTSGDRFMPSDIEQVHEETAPGDFSIDVAVGRFPERAGQNTFLTETLAEFTRGYTGLVWLVTDNIVENGIGEPEAGVESFFRTLNTRPEFRSVHLYKHVFADEATRQRAALAIYAILVSHEPVPNSALVEYDRKFEELRNAEHAGERLFPGGEHLKLKDLRVGAIELKATLKLHVEKPGDETYDEGKIARLDLDGTIRSYLTHHSVTSGRYALSIASPMVPGEEARRRFGAHPLPAQMFDAFSGRIAREIAPGATLPVSAILKSKEPIRLTPRGLGQRLRLALKIAEIDYSGVVRMTFTDVDVALRRDEMAGIFGIGRASRVFDFQDVRSLDVTPSESPVSFRIRTTMHRGWWLLGFVLFVALIAGAIWYALSRKLWFDVKVGSAPAGLVALARLGSHPVRHEHHVLGNLTRDLSGAYAFVVTSGVAGLTVTQSKGDPDAWDYSISSGGSGRLSIKPRGPARRAAKRDSGNVHSPGPPSSKPSAAAPPTPMKIGRPRT